MTIRLRPCAGATGPGMEFWQQLLLGALAVGALWLFLPSAKRAMKESPRGTASDWMGLLVPIGAVVAFVLLLIALL